MPSTIPYVPDYQFGSDPAPQNKVNAEALQTQFQEVSANLADLIDALGVSIRDDDTLTDELVRVRNLHPELRTYIDTILTGTTVTQALAFKFPVRASSVGNVPSRIGPKTLDGVACIVGDRVLLQAQTDPKENGIWVITAALVPWTRATDLPAGVASGEGWAVIVSEGTTLAKTVWVVQAGGGSTEQPIVNTNPLTFFQVFGPFPIPVTKGGTGATTAAGARANLGTVGVFNDAIVGTGSVQTFTVTHGLGSAAVDVTVRTVAGLAVIVDWASTGVNSIAVIFATPPALAETFFVTVQG